MTDVVRGAASASMEEEFARHLATLEAAWVGLPDKPEETPESTVRALWFAAAGTPCSVERASRLDPPELDAAGRRALRHLVERRLAGVPLAHLTGRQSFMGLELLAGPEALVPRRETELLGYAALDILRQTVRERGHAVVFDLCTGSGNLALALSHHEPGCRVFGGDVCPRALGLARRNAERTGLADRVHFFEGDMFAPFAAAGLQRAADLIVCNPPYISTVKAAGLPTEIADFEPRLAFDGGAFGISILFRLIAGAPHFLAPESWLCFEVGAGQGEPMAARLARASVYAEVKGVRDASGTLRVLLARTGSPA